MALEFLDSCSHLGSGSSFPPAINLDRKWTQASGCDYVTSPIRRSNPAFAAPACALNLSAATAYKTLTYQGSRYIGFAYYLSSGSPAGASLFCQMLSGGQLLAGLTVDSDNTVSILANNTVIWNSAPYTFTFDAYHYVEFYVELTGSTPIGIVATLKIDGVTLATSETGSTGVNASSLICNATLMNQVALAGGRSGNFEGVAMDIIVMNASGTDANGNTTTLNGFQGDVAIMTLVPDANVTTGWSLVGGSTQYGVLANIPPEDDVEYIKSDTVGQVSSVNMTPITGLTGTLLGAQLCIYAKKDAEGSRAIRGQLNGTDLQNYFAPGGSPTYDQYLYDYYGYSLFELDSLLGTAWTEANFNSAAFGVKVSV